MNFRVSTTDQMGAVKDYLDRLPEGKVYDITVTLHRQKRSDPQNNLYWKWVGIVARSTDNDAETVHKVFARMFLGIEVQECLGEKVAKIKSTTKLNTEEFTEYLERIEAFCLTELGIVLPHPEDRFNDIITNNND